MSGPGPASREPTPEQRAKERAVLFTSIADVAIVAAMALTAIGTGSLTMLGEATRGGLMTAVEIYALAVLRAVHRHRLARFQFGIGKVEQIFNLVIGVSLCLSGVWVAERMVVALLTDLQPSAPLAMAVAAVVNAINLSINLLGWLAMLAAARSDNSPIFRAQRRARGVKTACSILLQSALTIAALTGEPTVALALDAAGAGFVAAVMLVNGSRMMAACAPDLLDHALTNDDRAQIQAVIDAEAARWNHPLRLRTRRCGGRVQAEIVLAIPPGRPCVEVKRQVAQLHRLLSAALPDADLGVAVELASVRAAVGA